MNDFQFITMEHIRIVNTNIESGNYNFGLSDNEPNYPNDFSEDISCEEIEEHAMGINRR